ncbi:unnamed protein product, partial [marine sediment metagenome]
MLFILPAKQQVTVDTSQMLFPLDIIFIKDDTVLSIASDISPGYLVEEATPCDMFLEVNAGEAALVEVGDTVSVTVTQEPGFDLSGAISFAIPLAVLGLVCATVGGMARSMGGSSSSPKQLGATEFSPEVQAVIDKWRSQIAKGEPLVESEARKEIIRAQGYKGGVGETDRAIRAIKEPPTVKCPICGKVIEVPEYDKVSRSEALRKHIEKEHGHHSTTSAAS